MNKETEFYSKIVGTTFCDGQEILKSLSSGDRLRLVAEPSNSHDPNAIMVFKDRDRIGYIPKDTAKMIKEEFKDHDIRATVSEVTGKDKSNLGCNLFIEVFSYG